MEIQKAEEFANELCDDIHDRCEVSQDDSDFEPYVDWNRSLAIINTIDLIRARDKAIIERCKEVIHKNYYPMHDPGYCDGIIDSEQALDSILRELEGGA